MLAAAISGLPANLALSQSTIGCRSRSNIHSARPRVHMFFERSASLLPRPNGLTASIVSALMSNASTSHLASEPSSSGLASYLAFSRLRLVNSPVSAMMRPPGLSASRLVLSAAGFIATSTSGASPAVSIAVEPKLIWNAETPNSVPCGARISAGKSGKVAKSLPASAVDSVNCPPVSCMPSPLSPAKRTTTASGACVSAGRSAARVAIRSVLLARGAAYSVAMGARRRIPLLYGQLRFSVAGAMRRVEIPTVDAYRWADERARSPAIPTLRRGDAGQFRGQGLRRQADRQQGRRLVADAAGRRRRGRGPRQGDAARARRGDRGAQEARRDRR